MNNEMERHFYFLVKNLSKALLGTIRGEISVDELCDRCGDFYEMYLSFFDDEGRFVLKDDFEPITDKIHDILMGIDQAHDYFTLWHFQDHPEIIADWYESLTGDKIEVATSIKDWKDRVKERIQWANTKQSLQFACDLEILRKLGKEGRDLVAEKMNYQPQDLGVVIGGTIYKYDELERVDSKVAESHFNKSRLLIELQREAAFILGELGDKRCIPVLITVALDKNRSVTDRRRSVKLLTHFRSKYAKNALLELISDLEVWDLAVNKLLKYKDSRILTEVARSLRALRRIPKAREILLNLSQSPSKSIRNAAVKALEGHE